MRAADQERPLLPWLAPLAVGLLTVAVFLPALRNGFVWDDVGLLVDNPNYRGFDLKELRWMFSTFLFGPYQPVSWLTYGLDYKLWGMNPFGYHLTNVLLHAANAFLFYRLSLRLLAVGRAEPEDFLGAACAALVFSLHPLRVESVAWVSERRDVLSGFFFLITLLLWLRALRGRDRPDRLWSALAWGAYLLALLAKAMVVTLPAILVLMDVYPLRRLPASPREWFSSRARSLWKEKLPFLAPAAAFAVIGAVCQARWGAVVPLRTTSFSERLAQSLFGLSYYLGKTLVPFHLSPDYVWHWQTARVPCLLTGGCALAAAAALIAARKRWPAGLAAFCCYAITLAPVIGILKLGHATVADRYSYLACLGWALLAGAGLRQLGRAWRTDGRGGGAFLPAFAVLAAALACFSVLTVRQIRPWRDSVELWRFVLRLDPLHPMARRDLGMALLEQNRVSETALLWKEHLRLFPDDQETRRGLAALIAKAWGVEPSPARLYNDAGVELIRSGDDQRAVWYFNKALKLDPELDEARKNLAIAGPRAQERDAR